MTDSNDLIKSAQRTGRLFRIFHSVLIIVAVVILVFLAVLGIQTNQQLKKQLQQNHDQNQQQAANTQQIISEMKSQNDVQTAYIHCIAEFFAQPNRTGTTISDLDNCQISASGGSQPSAAASGSQRGVQSARTAPGGSQPVVAATPVPTPAPQLPTVPPTSQPNVFERILQLVSGLL